MVVGMDMVTRMMIYNKQTCKYAAMYSKRAGDTPATVHCLDSHQILSALPVAVRRHLCNASWLGHAKYAVRRGSELPENANFT